jgi:toxin YoeB
MRRVTFVPKALQQYQEWALKDRDIYEKIDSLIEDILRTPFTGLGKPEPLKYQLHGSWSRRISQKDRLVYEVRADEVVIWSCKDHT